MVVYSYYNIVSRKQSKSVILERTHIYIHTSEPPAGLLAPAQATSTSHSLYTKLCGYCSPQYQY